MTTSTKVISLSVPPELHAALKEVAGLYNPEANLSEYARMLFGDFMHLSHETYEKLREASVKRDVPIADLVEYLADRFPLADETVKPVVLKIPVDIIADRQKLKEWLTAKVQAITDHLHPICD